MHNCVVLSDGSMRCWGGNSAGQLGNGSNADSASPVSVKGLPAAVSTGSGAITCGDAHSCAVLVNGRVMCWGSNDNGQLGNDSQVSTSDPVLVSNLDKATAVTAGAKHTCALMADKTVWCWGNNNNARLGSPMPAGMSLVPIQVMETETTVLSSITAISAGLEHTCALQGGNGLVRCWGNPANARTGSLEVKPPVYSVLLMRNGAVFTQGTSLAGGAVHNCVGLSTGGVRCWGSNAMTQLGVVLPPSTTVTASPVDVAYSGGVLLSNVSTVAASSTTNCGLLKTGTIVCWGSNSSQARGVPVVPDPMPTDVPGLVGVKVISSAASAFRFCVLLENGSATCWGDDAPPTAVAGW